MCLRARAPTSQPAADSLDDYEDDQQQRRRQLRRRSRVREPSLRAPLLLLAVVVVINLRTYCRLSTRPILQSVQAPASQLLCFCFPVYEHE